MATTTEIDKALDEIALSIDRNRKSFNTALNNISSVICVISMILGYKGLSAIKRSSKLSIST